jgi:hypothetical protein
MWYFLFFILFKEKLFSNLEFSLFFSTKKKLLF